MASALDRVIESAENAASNLPVAQAQGQQLQAYTPPAAPARPSLAGMADSAGISVDSYLTVKDTGFRLGDAKAEMFKEATVSINLNRVVPIVSIRANRAGATTFVKSYDGVSTSQGQSFQQAEANLRSTHEKVDGPYQTAEIPATLLKDVGGQKKGSTIGITPSITGVKFFTKFYNELREKGLANATVDVKISHLYQTNNKSNEWGVVEFELIGESASA